MAGRVLSVVIPCHNMENNIEEIVKQYVMTSFCMR